VVQIYDQYPEIRQKWEKVVETYSIKNDIASRFFFHTLLGAFFRKKHIQWGGGSKDLRIHPFWFQSSRTGKDQMAKVLVQVARALGLKVTYMTDFTGDAALLGYFDSDIHNQNKKYGLTPDNPMCKIKGGREVVYQDPVVRGDLFWQDIIIFSEAKLLFQSNSEKLLSVLQPALDNFGFVYKKMKYDEPIDYPCNASLVMMSIPVEEMKKSIVDQGFFQRTGLYIRRMSIDEIQEMRNEAREKLRNVTVEERDHRVNDLVEALNKYDRSEDIIRISDKAANQLQKIQDMFIDTVRERIQGREIEPCMSFSHTAEELMVKMGAHIAILRGRNTIEEKDVWAQYIHIQQMVNTIINEVTLDSSQAVEKEQKYIFNYIEKLVGDGSIQKTSLRKAIQQKFKIGRIKAERNISLLVQNNYLVMSSGNKHNEKLISIRKLE